MSKEEFLQEDSFDKNRLFDYVKKFSFPRLAGSEGEKEAVKLTEKTFKELGFGEKQIEKETFKFSDFYSTTLIVLIMMMSLTFNLIVVFSAFVYPFITIFFLVGMAIVILLIMKGLKHPELGGFWGEYFGDTVSATNVTVKINAKKIPESEAGNIIISAHLDSKSQSFKTAWRIVIYRVWLFSGILFGGSILITMVIGIVGLDLPLLILDISGIKIPLLNFIIIILAVIVCFSNASLMFLTTHNKSPGALDNATGMAIVFELSAYFKTHPLDNFNMWFCQFSAEELGTMGSRIFVNKYEHQFEKGRVFQFNFDMVSSALHSYKKNSVEYLKSYGVLPRKKIAPILSKYLDDAAKVENLRINGFHLTTGAHLDSVPFHLRGFSAVDISTRAAALWTHNKVDTPDKVDPQILLEACLISRRAILTLDKDYETLCKNKDIKK